MYKQILIPLDNSAADEAILCHIRPLARLTGARLTLVHVADGFMARNQQRLSLDESEEMRKDRAYLNERQNELVPPKASRFRPCSNAVSRPNASWRLPIGRDAT